MATRAIHLELAFGPDANSFMEAFYRMTSRKGLPEKKSILITALISKEPIMTEFAVGPVR